MSISSKQRKRFTETCLSSCEPLAIGEDEVLVRRRQAKECECNGVGERLGAFVLLKEYEPPSDVSLESLVLTLALTSFFTYAFASSYSSSTNVNLVTSFFGFLAGLLMPLTVQSALTFIIALKRGVPLRLNLFPAPSLLPGILPSFVPLRTFKDSREMSLVYLIPLLVGVVSAIALAYLTNDIMYVVILKPANTYVKLLPVSMRWLEGAANPIQLGALAYLLSAFFQLSLYPFSPSWAALRFVGKSWWYPALLWIVIYLKGSIMGTLVFGYALAASLLGTAPGEPKPVKEPIERPSLIGLLLLLLIAVLTAPVS